MFFATSSLAIGQYIPEKFYHGHYLLSLKLTGRNTHHILNVFFSPKLYVK